MSLIIPHQLIRKYSFNLLLLILLLSLPISTNLFGQVKIKERIEIEPPILNLQKAGNNISSSRHTVRFEIDWECSSFDGYILVERPYNIVPPTGWHATGSLSLTVDDVVSPVDFMFQYRLNTNWGVPCNTNYRIYLDGDLVKSGSPTLTARYNDYGYARIRYILEKEKIEVLEPVSGAKEIIDILSEIPTTIVKARLKNYNNGNVDYNFKLEVLWAKTDVDPQETINLDIEGNITVQNASTAEWTIPWEGKFNQGYSRTTKLIVTAVADGETYTEEISNPYKILADEAFNKYIIHTSPTGVIPIYSDEPENLYARAYKGVSRSGVPFEYLPAETKYNLEITEGQEHGILGYKANGNTVSETGKALYNLDHYYGSGRLYFEYQPYKKVLSKENVTIKVSTTDSAIEPVDMKLVLAPNPFLAEGDSETIQAGETSDFVLKVYDETKGEYIDFADDHEFYVELWEGWDYGDIYSEYEDDVWWYWWDIPGPFSFIANDEIFVGEDEDKDEVTVLVYAETYIVYDDDGNPLPTITAPKDKIAGKRNKLSRDEVAMLRKQFREERKKEMLQNKGKGKGSVVYEKDNVKITQLDYGSAPNETLGSTTVFTYFEIVINKGIDILLGETKYFGVLYKQTTEGNKYRLAEIPTSYGSDPRLSTEIYVDGWDRLKHTDVWGSSPIEVQAPKPPLLKGKSGVYWEKKWFKGSDNSNQPLIDEGLIRIIGRYWEEGKEEDYKVKLKAEVAGIELETKIKVVKPSKLGDGNYSYKDIKGYTIQLDDYIIKFAGKNGIPPQIIKSLIKKESNFTAGYRYEPFLDAGAKKGYGVVDNTKYKNNQYYVNSSTDQGDPPIPTDHTHVNPNNYWGYQNTIWEFFFDHSSTLNSEISYGSENDLYPQIRKTDDKVLWYTTPANNYNDKYNSKKDELSKNGKLSEEEIESMARNHANNWLKTEFRDGIFEEGIAQTRMAASYGLMQLTYTTAHEDHDYDENNDNLPEKLNETEKPMETATLSLSKYLAKELKEKSKENLIYSWDGGFETRMKFGLNRYNGKRKKKEEDKENPYGLAIIKYSQTIKLYSK